jgi:hypothetical protein
MNTFVNYVHDIFAKHGRGEKKDQKMPRGPTDNPPSQIADMASGVRGPERAPSEPRVTIFALHSVSDLPR